MSRHRFEWTHVTAWSLRPGHHAAELVDGVRGFGGLVLAAEAISVTAVRVRMRRWTGTAQIVDERVFPADAPFAVRRKVSC